MTEQEAKTKWCPINAIAIQSTKSYPVCIASDCMMWRWEDENGYFKRVTDDMKMSGMDSKEAMECLPREGWCGLEGKP